MRFEDKTQVANRCQILQDSMPLRFDQTPVTPKRSLISGSQLRLMSLAAGLVLVVMLMQMADSPATKRKLELLFGGEATPAPAVAVPTNPPAAIPTELGDRYLPGLDIPLLETIEDNTTFVDEEADAWFHLLGLLQNTSDAELQAASVGKVAYPQLISQSEFYRGRVVELAGTVKRVEQVQPADNDLGIEKLNRVLIRPSRNGQMPVTLYCLEEPAGWKLDEAIVVQGVFFKNQVYKHQQGIDLTPVLLARTFLPTEVAATPAPAKELPPAWQLVALAVVIAAMVIGIVLMKSNGQQPRPAVETDASEVADSLRRIDSDLSGQDS